MIERQRLLPEHVQHRRRRACRESRAAIRSASFVCPPRPAFTRIAPVRQPRKERRIEYALGFVGERQQADQQGVAVSGTRQAGPAQRSSSHPLRPSACGSNHSLGSRGGFSFAAVSRPNVPRPKIPHRKLPRPAQRAAPSHFAVALSGAQLAAVAQGVERVEDPDTPPIFAERPAIDHAGNRHAARRELAAQQQRIHGRPKWIGSPVALRRDREIAGDAPR